MTMDDKWKDRLQERFSDYSAPEPEGLWEGIEQDLSKRKGIPLWWLLPVAAAAAVALFVVFGRGGGHPPLPVELPQLTAETDTPSIPAVEAQVGPEEKLLATGDVPVRPVVRKPRRQESPHSAQVELDAAEPLERAAETVPEDSRPSEESSFRPVTPGPEEEYFPDTFPDGPVRTAGRGRSAGFSVDVYRECGDEGSRSSEGYGMVQTALITKSSPSDGDLGGLVRMMSANKPSTFEARHGTPVRLGISLAWHVDDHLSFSTGLTRTSLSSTFEESTASSRHVTVQDLVYAGIPLRVRYGSGVGSHWQLYASAGMMGEWCISASSHLEEYVAGRLLASSASVPEKGAMLWSAGAAVGIEYLFSRRVGVYFEPGLEYHFKATDAPVSVYTDKPLNSSFTFGLRFHFGK